MPIYDDQMETLEDEFDEDDDNEEFATYEEELA